MSDSIGVDVKRKWLFSKMNTERYNKLLENRHKLLFFEHGWCPRPYPENAAPRYVFLTALFNMFFLIESAPMLTASFKGYCKKHGLINANKNFNKIRILRNLFAHNCTAINGNVKFYKDVLCEFVANIDEGLPYIIDNAFMTQKDYVSELPTDDEFWECAISNLIKMVKYAMESYECSLNTEFDMCDFEKSYQRYMIWYLRNYMNRNNVLGDADKCCDKLEKIMKNNFVGNWGKIDIFPDTICKNILNM